MAREGRRTGKFVAFAISASVCDTCNAAQGGMPVTRLMPWVVAIAFAALWLAAPAVATSITSVSPSPASSGDTITILGSGFGASNVDVEVCGKSAKVVRATGNTALVVVPDRLPPGACIVTATNPGGH